MKLWEVIKELANKTTSKNTSNYCDNCSVGHRTQHRSNWHSITEQEPVKEPDIPIEKVRMVLAEKIQLGFIAEVRELIQKYGAEKGRKLEFISSTS